MTNELAVFLMGVISLVVLFIGILKCNKSEAAGISYFILGVLMAAITAGTIVLHGVTF